MSASRCRCAWRRRISDDARRLAPIVRRPDAVRLVRGGRHAGAAAAPGAVRAAGVLRCPRTPGACVMNPDVQRKPYLTSEEAAEYLGLPSVNALRMRMKRGTVPSWCYSHFGGSLRFMRA